MNGTRCERAGQLVTRYCLGVLILCLVGATACGSAESALSRKPTVRIGSTNFSEQIILAELYAKALEGNAYRVERKLRLGNREVVAPALENGEIDLYVEYLASAERFLAGEASRATSDPSTTHQALQRVLQPRGLSFLEYAPAVNQNGLVVTRATADVHKLSRTSDLAPIADQLVLGGPPECPVRPFCLAGLERVYAIKFKDFRPLDPGGPLTVNALLGNQIDVAILFTTDPRIADKGLVLLDDDRHLQQADNIAPLVRDDLLARAPPEFKNIINGVTAKLTTRELTQLAKAVDIDRTEAGLAAATWLKARNVLT